MKSHNLGECNACFFVEKLVDICRITSLPLKKCIYVMMERGWNEDIFSQLINCNNLNKEWVKDLQNELIEEYYY